MKDMEDYVPVNNEEESMVNQLLKEPGWQAVERPGSHEADEDDDGGGCGLL